MSKSKNKYLYYPVIMYHGAISGKSTTGEKDFRTALRILQDWIPKTCINNSIDFIGVIKAKEGTNPLDRINGFEENNINEENKI